MKKVLLYIESMKRGGAERVMSIIANSFAEKNYNVILVTEIPIDNTEEYYNISEKIKTICIDFDNTNFIKKNYSKIKNLRKIIKNEQPDVILSFLGLQNIRMLIASNKLKCKKFVSVRNDPNKEYGTSKLKTIIAKFLFRRTDGVIFQTEDAKLFFNKKIQKKSIVIANPIDNKFFNINQIENPHNIISVGRLEPQKNNKLLIDAYSKIDDTKDKLLIYGEGSLKQELQEYIDAKKLSGKVILMGNSENIEQELKKAKIFVLSSDYEGMPNAFMEAMAVGLPCISTDCPCGGPKYLIENNKEGLLVPCNDVEKMVEALKKMLSSDYKKIGKLAKIRANNFTTEKIINQWEKYLMK